METGTERENSNSVKKENGKGNFNKRGMTFENKNTFLIQ